MLAGGCWLCCGEAQRNAVRACSGAGLSRGGRHRGLQKLVEECGRGERGCACVQRGMSVVCMCVSRVAGTTGCVNAGSLGVWQPTGRERQSGVCYDGPHRAAPRRGCPHMSHSFACMSSFANVQCLQPGSVGAHVTCGCSKAAGRSEPMRAAGCQKPALGHASGACCAAAHVPRARPTQPGLGG